MIEVMEKTRRLLWAFVELAFIALLAIILIYLILGKSSGAFVESVADNVLKFAAGVPTPSLIGLAIVGLLIYMVAQRMKWAQSDTPPPSRRPAARKGRAGSDTDTTEG